MVEGRSRPGEQFYPPHVSWSTKIPTGTLPDLLSNAAAQFGSSPAMEFRGRQLSFTELKARADAAASAFLAAGSGENASIALFLGNTPDHPVVFFGILRAGARVVHLSPLDGEIALSHKLADSGARILVTSNLSTLLPTAVRLLDRGLVDRVIVCDDNLWGSTENSVDQLPANPAIVDFARFIENAAVPLRWPVVSENDVAVLQYTGGTTGLPKGAMLTHRNLTAAVGICELWNVPPRPAPGMVHRVIGVLPLFHIFALVVVLLRSLKLGDVISLHQRFVVEGVLHDIETCRATAFPGVPTMWIAIANLPDLEGRDLSSLSWVGSGGAPLPVEIARRLERKTGLSLVNGWGMTETCSPGTGHPPTGPDKPGSIGVMLPNIDMDVVALDEPARVLPVGEIGEIRVAGPNVTKGYWKKPKETAEAFIGDRFLTGDIGYMDADGYFYLVDRKKDLIISSGFNVYPQMIEQAIYLHPDVHEVMVIGIPDDYRGEAAKAFIKLRSDSRPFVIEELRTFLAGKVGKHELPIAVEFVDELPRTTVGKLSRHELRTQQAKQQQADFGMGRS